MLKLTESHAKALMFVSVSLILLNILEKDSYNFFFFFFDIFFIQRMNEEILEFKICSS